MAEWKGVNLLRAIQQVLGDPETDDEDPGSDDRDEPQGDTR